MHLRSISMKGFKSFPDRTRMEFGPGVSVIVGPNGSGKSNVTDAVLWAMGEQSPLAVRGQSMQDVIFGGGRGMQARTAAEVELVLDNADGTIDLPVGEISILRRLDRSGDGEYRLNGARCRLVDVLEILSDTGLGKEMHSVVSQGRVEAIVTSRPRDRRLLIEEAAGLGKHRKRRRRAQLKLERTEANLDRALDVEREARTRLRPLKRQAEAAELHERLERQVNEARWELARDAVRARHAALKAAEREADVARAARDGAERALEGIAREREAAEEALAKRTERREELARRVWAAKSAADGVTQRLERVRTTGAESAERAERRARRLQALEAEALEDVPVADDSTRVADLEAEIAELAAEHERELVRELETLQGELAASTAKVEELKAATEARRAELREADAASEAARATRRDAERDVEAARREATRVGSELAACNQALRLHQGAPGGARSLADELEVEAGCERALAAVLGGRLRAALVEDLAAAAAALDRAGADGGRALVVGDDDPAPAVGDAPVPGAQLLGDLLRGPDRAVTLARRLLAGAWVVDDVAALPPGFTGIAVTREGRVWNGGAAELRQAAEGGEERVLAQRNRRDELIAASEVAVGREHTARAAADHAGEAVAAADRAREAADRALRDADRERTAAQEDARRSGWLIEQRRKAPQEGASAVRRAQLEGELAAERRVAERAARERELRARQITMLRDGAAADRALVPVAERLATALDAVARAMANRVEALEAELSADRSAGEGDAERLRSCAAREAETQRQLREHGETLMRAEVRAQGLRDQAAEAGHQLERLAGLLGLEAQPATDALADEQVHDLQTRIERLTRRREQLGPVNPLAKAEYDEALAHVEELERQRTDLETAMRELKTFVRDTDRQIRETFEQTFAAAAANFEELAQQLFPGGRGRLRLVHEDAGPRPVGDDGEPVAEPEDELDPEEDRTGVEIEITPAGKSMKRLTLLSGGEKSMTALAFLFSVFLARPCPFYILDEVEAALDDLNITRFLDLVRTYADRAQFIVVTHQRRTMEAADVLYGVSMGDDGVSKVISRRLPREAAA